jgi:hypothetical protein
MSRYITQIATRAAGIPCLIGVTTFRRVRGHRSFNAPSDLDYYGYVEVEWEVLDRKGRPAPWLDRKLTDRDRADIESEIIECMD